MTTLAQYDRGRAVPDMESQCSVRELGMRKDDLVAKLKRASDMVQEASLVSTILNYARSGHATPLMIEQAIVLIDKHIAWSEEDKDQSHLALARRMKVDLERALIEGVKTLKAVRGPGPEFLQVEDPIAFARLRAGHKIRRQMRCTLGAVDIFDLTADELIECKLRGTGAALGEAAGQLQRYRQSFPGASLTIAVLSVEPDGQWLAALLAEQGIRIIEIEKGDLL